MIDITPEYLLNVVDEETALKICESLEGMRIYIPKNFTKYRRIIKDYISMKEKHFFNNVDAINELSYKYELSSSQIRKIIKKDIPQFNI